MRAREAAVSAVSDPEKKAEKSRSSTIAPRTTPSPSDTILRGLPLPQQGPKLAGVDIAGDEGIADPADEDEGELAVDDFLVLSHQRDEPVRVRQLARNVGERAGQSGAGEVLANAHRVLSRAEAEPRGKLERKRHAHGDAFAMHETIRETGRSLERMAESVAEIEQRAHAAFTFVGGNGRRLRLAALHDRLDARLDVAFLQTVEIGLEPVEETAVADQPVFDDFGIAREELAHRQGGQRIRIGEHEARLMESACKVLPVLRVDAGLAADGTVHLGEQGRRNLGEVDAATQDRRRKASQVADHATAQRDHEVAAFDLLAEQPFGQLLKLGKGFRALARGQANGGVADARRVEAFLQRRQVKSCHGLVGYDGNALAPEKRGEMRARGHDETGTDENVIGPVAEVDPHFFCTVSHLWAPA